jgi:hypothetical protein
MKHIINVKKLNINEDRKKQLWEAMLWFIAKMKNNKSCKTSTRRKIPKKIQCSARKWNVKTKEERNEWLFEIVEVTKLLKYPTSS